ncbi:MAG TPA: methyltransferase domain-containing protein [Acidimicrobiia bacterium]|nr:methyltransferase domain-containing protein [Acidimicrobiia bacterium]
MAGLLDRVGIDSGRFVDLGAGAVSLLPSSLSVRKLDLVRPDGVEGTFVQGSAEALPFGDATLDGIGLFDVLEHLDEPGQCLKEVGRVVRSGGVVLVTVPAYQWLWSPHDDLVDHKRRYTPDALRQELEAAGMSVSWLSGFYGFLMGPAAARKVLSLESPMSMPPPALNRMLTSLAARSVRRSLRRSTGAGLSLAAVAAVA